MIGAIVGDVVGSVYEFNNIRTKQFPLITKDNFFTDDTIMTVAIMEWLLNPKKSIIKILQKWGKKYPSSYGGRFGIWIYENDPQPYYSFGNGAAMRISPVSYVAKNLKELEELVIKATTITHSHPEGIKGALVTATCVYLALHNCTKQDIEDYAVSQYPEIKEMDYNWLKRNYWFDESCQNSVPQAIYCFLISKDFEDCIRTTISIGGDCDTTSAISGAIADAFYGIPQDIEEKIYQKLTPEMNKIINRFNKMVMKEQGK